MKIVKNIILVVASISLYKFCTHVKENTFTREYSYRVVGSDYSDAIEEIMKSDMISSHKENAVKNVLCDQDRKYYSEIINIVNSDMLSIDKLKTITGLNRGLNADE
jgi:hypothetical protein